MFWLGFFVVSFKQQDKFPDFITCYYVTFQHLCTIENHSSPHIHLTHITFFYFFRRVRFTRTENRHIFFKVYVLELFEKFGGETNGCPWPQLCCKRKSREHFMTNVVLTRVCMLVVFISGNVASWHRVGMCRGCGKVVNTGWQVVRPWMGSAHTNKRL